MVSKLSEIWSGLFIPDPDPDFLPIPDSGSRGQKCTGSATLKKMDLDRDGLCSEQVRVAEGLDRLLPPLHQLEDNYAFTAHLHTSTQWIVLISVVEP